MYVSPPTAVWQLRASAEGDPVPLHGLAWTRGARLCHTHPGLPQESEKGAPSLQGAYDGPLQVSIADPTWMVQVRCCVSLCSAGVGRTGTFITIDQTLEQVEKEKVVNIAQVINNIRRQRMKMVQTLVCGRLNCIADTIHAYMHTHTFKNTCTSLHNGD